MQILKNHIYRKIKVKLENHLTPRNKGLNLQIKQPKLKQKKKFSNKLVTHWIHLVPSIPYGTD